MKYFLRFLLAAAVAHHSSVRSELAAQTSLFPTRVPESVSFSLAFRHTEMMHSQARKPSLTAMVSPRSNAAGGSTTARGAAIGIVVGGLLGLVEGASRPVQGHCAIDLGYPLGCALNIGQDVGRASNMIKGGLLGGAIGALTGGAIGFVTSRVNRDTRTSP